ncbi:MAG: hypothetical protein JSU67_05820 [Gammaproteobacteria bacterium]|nr:MAG: hypothetical protein JSU67_05820 [Gammaproteobacteria bacterium]
MKCPNCSSQMFVTNEIVNSRSQVTFYRCSVCVSEHVSSEAIVETAGYDGNDYFNSPLEEKKRYLMV